jgi:hypothetical protein
MPLVTGKEILNKADREGYAVDAFNINNMEILGPARDLIYKVVMEKVELLGSGGKA